MRDGDGRGGVQADQVGQRERAHRVRAAGDHRGVDVLGGGEPGLDHPDRGEQVRDQQRVDDEAGPVLGQQVCLPSRSLGERPRRVTVVSSRCSRDGTSSTSGSTGTGLKKCMPDDPLRACAAAAPAS